MAKVKIKDLNPARFNACGSFSRYDEYFNLLMNAIKIRHKITKKELEFSEETFAKNALLELGSVGYDKIVNKWYYVYGEGVDQLGNPTKLVFVTANGRTYSRSAYYNKDKDGAYMIKALPIAMTMASLIRYTTDFMDNCDNAIRQNVDACKTPYIVVVRDENLKLSYEQAIRQKQEGQAVVLVSEELSEGLKSIPIKVDFLADKFFEVRDKARDTLLNKIGILTANIDKKERVQSSEVNATLGLASDYIYLLIDTFNKQMETYDIPYEMVFNGAMEEIYLNNDENINDVNVNDASNNLQERTEA